MQELERLSVGGTEQTGIPDLMKAVREYMLEESSDELHRGECHQAGDSGIGFPVTEGNRCVPDVFNALIGESDTIDIGSEIL